MKIIKKFLFWAALGMVASGIASCGNENEPDDPAKSHCEGVYSGTLSLDIADKATYSADISVTVSEENDKTITVTFPEYTLSATVMGNLTIGKLTISGLIYDAEKGGYFRNYGNLGLTQHFKAQQGERVTMDSDYPLNEPSSILVKFADNGSIIIENPYKIGAMPFPLTAFFSGNKPK